MFKNVDECVLASFRGDIDILSELAQTNDLKDYYISGWAGDYQFPLWAVPKTLLYIIGGSGWSNERDKMLEPARVKMVELIRWWDIVYGIDAGQDIEFNKYHECFFSEDPELSLDEIFYGYDIEADKKSCLVRQIDLELYAAAEKFQYDEVEYLLQRGANPHSEFEDYDVYGRIVTECAYLSVMWLDRWLNVFDGHTVLQEDFCLFMCDFIGLAAHERMYDLIVKYAPKTG